LALRHGSAELGRVLVDVKGGRLGAVLWPLIERRRAYRAYSTGEEERAEQRQRGREGKGHGSDVR